jgi:hypothetical protein
MKYLLLILFSPLISKRQNTMDKSTTQDVWLDIANAPKTGEVIEISYDETGTETCLAFWSDRPVCMGGPTVYIKPGWATAGDNVDKNLPLDLPILWREVV